MTDPLVSVLMSVYNGERFLAEAIESIIKQTYTGFEFIVINDGSMDHSADILYYYENKDKRLHVYHQENRGLIPSLNWGLELARGKYLARIDADDISYPHRLEKQVEIFEECPDLVILGSAYEVIDDTGESIGLATLPTTDTGIRWEMIFKCPFAHPSVMLRLNVLRQQKLFYDPSALHAEDYELWSRLLKYGQGLNYSEPLVKRRIHDNRIGQLAAAQQQDMSDKVTRSNFAQLGFEFSLQEIRILRDWFGKFPSRLNQQQVDLCSIWFEIMDAFASQPELDLNIWRPIRGRWITRLMLARTELSTGSNWKMRLFSYLRLNDVKAVLSYVCWRIFDFQHRL